MLQTTKSERPHRLAGFTLVELMVSLFIVGIVMMGWWRIMNATSPYREAQRRAAVEVAAGMLDIFPDDMLIGEDPVKKTYAMNSDGTLTPQNGKQRFPSGWMPSDSPLCYTLTVNKCEYDDASLEAWQRWIVGGLTTPSYYTWVTLCLYDSQDVSCVAPFAIFRQLLAWEGG